MPVIVRAIKIKKRYLIGLVAILIFVAYVFIMIKPSYTERNIKAMSYVLANKVIVIDAGHGGRDPGKIGHSGVAEKDINLEVSKRLATILGQMGAAVILTRDTDIDLSDSSASGWRGKKRQDLSRRVGMANDRNADLYISIHCNAYPGKKEHGAQVFSQPKSLESKVLAEAIQKKMTSLLGNTTRKAKQVDYFALRETKMPAVIVEIGFITNPTEDKLLQDPLYQSKVAYSIAAGVIQYYAAEKEGEENTPEESGQENILKTFKQQPGNFIPAP